MITSAIDLVRRRGVAGTGVTELLTASNTARGSIYQHFPGGKQQLVEESTRVAGQVLTAAIAAATEVGDPLDALESFVRMWQETLTTTDFTAGCPVVAAALAGHDAPGLPAAAAEAFTEWNDLIATKLADSGVEPGTARSLATFTISAVEGAVILALSTRSVRPLEDVHRHLVELVRLHLPPRCGVTPE
ncbi:TetR/AcrR family transcriptional regulator [Amycolatopsis cihanbeyliensis]|uniref:TetR/AcrR family transcriptional regulator n=1 Tax=Amycolatopsis cihanbeyliensis TaxID=1128664 RepID=UPI001B85E663|nr:TetR/AcrR family transcriptional regulator [Amycolatopsis cihanbeyliensis]